MHFLKPRWKLTYTIASFEVRFFLDIYKNCILHKTGIGNSNVVIDFYMKWDFFFLFQFLYSETLWYLFWTKKWRSCPGCQMDLFVSFNSQFDRLCIVCIKSNPQNPKIARYFTRHHRTSIWKGDVWNFRSSNRTYFKRLRCNSCALTCWPTVFLNRISQ